MTIPSGPPLLGRMALTTVLFMMGVGLVCGESAANTSLGSAANTSLESFPEEHECCIIHGFSEELFTECCTRVGVCPDCPPISRVGGARDVSFPSCCFNERPYSWGSVLARFPECCTNLMCGGKMIPHYPFVVSTIVAVKVPPTPGQDCDPLYYNYCLDHHGVIRMEGSEWLTTHCRQCSCLNGLLTCQPIRPVCPLPPQPYCRELPGDCCPTWDCTLPDGCVDDAGVHHEEGTSWSDSRYPCTIYYCTASGIVTLEVSCPSLPPRPYPRCTIITVGCCQQWSCTDRSGCVDEFGNQRVEGEQWVDPSDPCYTLTCTPTGIQRSLTHCPSLPPQPHYACRVEQIGCCRNWTCNGCVDDDGVNHDEGTTWSDPRYPCTIYYCTASGIVTLDIPCLSLPPRPHPRCTIITVGCCQQWSCTSGCVDEFGNQRVEGEQWVDPSDPCYTLTCTPTGIQRSLTPCPTLPPQPHYACRVEHIGCCRYWTCDGCVDDAGVHHDEGTSWSDPRDPCTIYYCTASGIESLDIPCPPLPPRPHQRCTIITVGCCQQWSCTSECVDELGNQRFEGEQWVDPSDPCYTLTCTPTGIQRSLTPCPTLPPQPHYTCRVEHIGCCRNWTCEGCVDSAGVHHDLYDTWTDETDECISHSCTKNGIISYQVFCPPPPPQPSRNCTLVTVHCCQEWDCFSGCPDPRSVDLVCTQVVGHDQCYTHSDCPGELCCPVVACGNRCIPVKKPGTCPQTLQPHCLHPRDQCKSDTDCPGIQICCPGFCGYDCFYPNP